MIDKELKVSISGIRGVWGRSLLPEVIFNYVKAYLIFLKKRNSKRVLIGRDGRITGKAISFLCSSLGISAGFDVCDCGIIPTPSLLLGVRVKKFDGGIIITASHNPEEWNALKFVKKGGFFLNNEEMEELKGYLNYPFPECDYKEVGSYDFTSEIEDLHIEAILKKVDVELIRSKKFKVVVDPVNSAGAEITKRLLEALGCDVTIINGEITGLFGRVAEPNPESLTELGRIVRERNADVGFAQDPDADRLVVVDENGNILSEEFTLPLCVNYILSEKKGDVVINLSTSMKSELIAKRYGVKCHRTAVGEANVVAGILSTKAVIGGEGNGGVIYPEMNLCRDSLSGIAIILESMAKSGRSVSSLSKELPETYMEKRKINTSAWEEFRKRGIEYFNINKFNITEVDGIRGEYETGEIKCWLHIRPSNTEPVIRIIGESTEKEFLKNHIDKICDIATYL